MFQIFRKELDWEGKKLVLETGKIARQADGAVLASIGETTVLCTVVVAKSAKPGQDFFPLTVNYQEKSFAAGKIPGGFFKREGRPSEKETLVSRLIDRPVRPLFVKGFLNEVQVICTVLSHDMENDPDIVSMIGASAALTISGAPFMGPIGAIKIGIINLEMSSNNNETKSGPENSGGWAETFRTVIYAVLIAVFIRTFAYEPFNIPSGSMIPTLLVGDYLFVSKYIFYDLETSGRGKKEYPNAFGTTPKWEQIMQIAAIVTDSNFNQTNQNMNEFCRPCLLYTSPSPRDRTRSRMPSSA